jgi:hypothetical protein
MKLPWMFDAGEDTTCYVDRRILSGDEPIPESERGEDPDGKDAS